jgi:hypothetical protein
MSSHLARSTGSRLLLVALLTMTTIIALSTLVAADHPVDEDENQGGTGLSEFTGDWLVGSGDDLMYANQTISLDGNLSLSDGGRLTLKNVTLILHGGEFDPQEINVFDGTLVISDWDDDPATDWDMSMVMANDSEANYYFAAYEESTLTLSSTQIRDCGRLFNLLGIQAGVYVGTQNAIIKDTEIFFGYGGLFIDGVDITVEDSNIHDNTWIGVYVDHDASPVLLGCKIEDNLREGLMVKDQSDVTVRDCSIRGNLRGAVVDGAFLTGHGTAISGNLELDISMPYFSTVDLFNCTISTSGVPKPIKMDNSSLSSTHGNFDVDKVDMFASTFFYQQYLTVNVTWTDWRNTPIPGVEVLIVDAEVEAYPSQETDINGLVAFFPVKVMDYRHNGLVLQTVMHNPFHITVTHNLQDKDTYADLRYNNAVVPFRYTDADPPYAIAPALSEVDVGTPTLLDGINCHDNVAVDSWNWSFEELGQMVYLEGMQVEYSFKEAKTYSITLMVNDTSDNTAGRSSVEFDVVARDRMPPVSDAGPDQEVEQGTVVTLDGSNSTDNVVIVEYTWSFTYDGAPRSIFGRVVTWSFDIPGVYLVVLTVIDNADPPLTDSDETTITVEDTTSPSTEVLFNPVMPLDRKYNTIVQIIFNVNDVGGGTVELNYRINGAVWEKVVGGLSLSLGDALQHGDGTYEIEYYAQDSVGNTEDPQTIEEFLVDATPPTFINMEPPVSPYTVTTETYTITGKTEPGAVLTISGEGVALATDGTFSYEATLALGDNAFYLHVEDQVGHFSDLTLIITRSDYPSGNGDNGGSSNALLYGAVGAVILIVVLLLVYIFVIQKRGDEGGEDL